MFSLLNKAKSFSLPKIKKANVIPNGRSAEESAVR
jgi:hypothetical protein